MKAPAAAALQPPFFILGCVRSGTTMLRNALRLHPALACPEETHFYRWGEPFGGQALRQILTGNATLKRHRGIDGIGDAEFAAMMDSATSRADLCRQYMSRYIALKKPGATRWFDKTPQNAYGASMIAMEMPQARFVHIVRDPVNVVASLRIGKVMKVPQLVAACNYWNEAIANLAVLKKAFPGRVLELSYEGFTSDPAAGLRQVLAFLDEPWQAEWFASVATETVRHEDSGVLSADELAQVRLLCRAGRIRHGYADADEEALHKSERKLRRKARKQGPEGAETPPPETTA